MIRGLRGVLLAALLALPSVCAAEGWTWDSGYKGDVPDASDTKTNTASFGANLSSADTDVQKALDTLDDVAGGGGGDNITVNATAATNANFLDNLYVDWAINTAATPDDLTAKFNYPALTGDHALLLNEVIFGQNGLIIEGATADTIELYLSFPDPATTDKTITLFNATDTVVGLATTDTLTNKTIAAADNVVTADDTICTDCLNATEIEDIYLLNSGDTSTGALTINDNNGAASTLLTIGDATDADSVAIFGDLTVTGGDITLGTTSIFSGGDTASLNNVDAVDATTEATLEAALDIAGDVSSTGMASTVIGADKVLESMLKAVDAAADEECLTYETTTGDFEWQTCGAGGATGWTDDGTELRLDTSTDEVEIGSAATLAGKLAVNGDTDEIQLQVQFNATQTTLPIVFENSAGTDVFTVSNTGVVVTGGSAGAGQSTIAAGLVVNNGNGTAEADDFIVKASGGTYEIDAGGGTFIATTNDLGWAVVDTTDNTACTTSCTSAAVMGWNDTAGVQTVVDRTNATADICLCAGGS